MVLPGPEEWSTDLLSCPLMSLSFTELVVTSLLHAGMLLGATLRGDQEPWPPAEKRGVLGEHE